jgi:hypothetical protein
MTITNERHIAVLSGLIETTLDSAYGWYKGVVDRVYASVPAGHDQMRDLKHSLQADPTISAEPEAWWHRRLGFVGP